MPIAVSWCGAGLRSGRGSFVDSAHPRLFREFLDSAIDWLLEGVDVMLPHKLHEFATSVRGTVNMEDVPREFLSISLNDHGTNFLELVVIEASCVVLPGHNQIIAAKPARGSCEHGPP